jgi:hypothetical protein
MVVVVEVGIVVVVVVVEVGIVVVVVVVVVDVPVPPAVGAEDPVPTTVRMAVGAEPPLCGDEVPAVAAEDGAFSAGDWAAPLDGASAATVPVLAEPVGTTAPTLGTVVGVLPEFEVAGPCAERICCATGPAPMLTPAMIDSAAATTAPDAMRRLRTKYSFGAAIGGGTTTSGGASGSGCPNVRDVKTSSKVA